jgi:hypothetical protein
MPDTRVFNEFVFNSYTNLQNFFLRSDAINQVLSRRDKPFSKVLVPLNSSLAGKWQVCQIATSPFRSVLAVVMEITSSIARLLGATGFAKQAKTGAQYLLAGFELYSEEPTKLFKIKNTANGTNALGSVINKTPMIPESRITDPKIKKKTWCSFYNGIKFNYNRGICWGISFWFLYLYLKTKDQFSDPRSHMAALGKQFAHGGGVDPTLLQNIHLRKGKLLGLKIGTQPAHVHAPGVFALSSETPAKWRSSAPEITHLLQSMPAGAYKIILPIHSTVFIKIHDKLGYFFEPNYGITEINGAALGEKLYQLVSYSLKKTGDIDEDLPNRIRKLHILPVTLR